MKFETLTARVIAPELIKPFSIGAVDGQERVEGPKRYLITLEGQTTEDIHAWGSVDTLTRPIYGEESTKELWPLVEELGEMFIGREHVSPEAAVSSLGYSVGHHFLKAGFANLWFDAEAQKQGLPLYRLLGGTKNRIEVGISMPASSTPADIQTRIDQGYRRIKVKVGPTREEYQKIAAIRQQFPDTAVMIDANSSFDHENRDHLVLLMDYAALGLLMIEQPLAHDDIRHHLELQARFNQAGLPGYLCLDESIHTSEDLTWAVESGIPIINIKIARVGGLHIAKEMIEYCQANGVTTWIGGMLEPTVSKSHSLAMAAHPGVTLPSDISGTKAYFKDGQDPVTRPMEVKGSQIDLPNVAGRGWEPDPKILNKVTQAKIVFNSNKIHPVVCQVPLR